MKKLVTMMVAPLVAGMSFAAATTHLAYDCPAGDRLSAGTEQLTYSNLWDGDENATVTIAQNGTPIFTGLKGEGTKTWTVDLNGRYELTHTTYVSGVAGKVETAVFVVSDKTATTHLAYDCPAGDRLSAGTEQLPFSNLWDGDENATVTIAQNGTPIFAGLKGEGTKTWTVDRNGRYELTHTTYTNGVKGKVETVVFVVEGKEVPVGELTIDLGQLSYVYDGLSKKPVVTVKDRTTTLTKDTHYLVDYKDNVDAGVAKVIVKGLEPYVGEVTNEFTIVQAANVWTVEPSVADKVYDGLPAAVSVGTAKFGSPVVTYDGGLAVAPTAPGAHSATFTVAATKNYAGLSTTLPYTIVSIEEDALEKLFDGIGAVASDGSGNITVTLTNEVAGLIEIPDNLGSVTVDLAGRDLVGADGADGDATTAGGNGQPAIRIVATGAEGTATTLTIVNSGETGGTVTGGKGGAGNPPGNGGAAVEVADGAKSGTKVNVGEGVTVTGGAGGDDATDVTVPQGRYVVLDLVKDLGVKIPSDVAYAAGDKVTIKVEGLAKGLKVVATPVYEDPNAKKKVIGDYVYTIEGVPTEPVDFEKQPMYARVTVTYKDKTKTADKTGKAETLQPVKLSIESAEVRTLAAGALNAVYEPVDIVALWPEVADAKANPKEWSFKGWPAGLKYNATAKDASWSYKDDKATVKATAAPYTVYGQPTKAGEYPITATWKHKLADGKTTVSETFSAVLTVWGDDGASDFRAVSQAYVALTKNFGTGVTAMSGLPTGLKFTAKAVAATAKAPAQEAGDVYGTPTKPGVFAVTATLADKTKETFLWKVTEGENPGLDAAAIGWADAKVKFDGGTKKATILQGLEADFAVEASALAAGAKVTVSGLPSGLKYDAKTGKITGIATKAESKVVTVKVVQNGVTEVRTFAIDIVANPFAGTYYAYLTDGSARETATAVLTPAVGGSVKVVLDEYVPSLGKTVKTTVSAKGFTMMKEYDPANPNAVQIAYDLELKANAKNNPDYASEVRALQLAFGLVKREEGLVVFIGQLVLKTGNDITCWGMAQKALTAAECAEVVDTIGFAPQSVLTGVFTDAGGGHLLYASAVLDEQKMQYKVTGKLGDGTVVKALLPIVYAFSEAAFYSAPCLLIEKGGAKRAYAMSFAHTKSDFAAKFWSHETAAAFQSCSAFVGEGIPVTAAEQLGGESELVLDAAELADFGYEGEAPVFRLMANGAELAKAKLDVYAPDAKEGAKPLASLASAKLQASAGYVFKGAFKWDAKVGGDGNTYSFELVPSAADGKTFVGRCEVKPAKGMSVAVGAWTRIPMDI